MGRGGEGQGTVEEDGVDSITDGSREGGIGGRAGEGRRFPAGRASGAGIGGWFGEGVWRKKKGRERSQSRDDQTTDGATV